MALISISKVALLAVLILSSQIMFSPLTNGAITPAEDQGLVGTADDVRPSNPGHSPGIGHAFTNNKVGRRLLITSARE
ncbi:hypothetical protein BRADI_1g60563v3 [Brachypodium distachyon]|uniref:Dirigent protein n=1 Tax=Brachypodium distachyon TaxID=15368 RepID=A0A0Q3HFU4_BRADI|nr:hypothetical protein BRADI_1g60563v3 [Brachypodium distachyon]